MELLDNNIQKYILNFGEKWGFSDSNPIEDENGNALGNFRASSDAEYGQKQILDNHGNLVCSIKKKFSFTSFKEPHQIKMPSGEHVGDVRRGKRWGYGKDMWVESSNRKIIHSKVPDEKKVTPIIDNDKKQIGHVQLEDFTTSDFLKGHPKSWVLYVDELEFDRLLLLALFLEMIHQKYSQNLGGGG